MSRGNGHASAGRGGGDAEKLTLAPGGPSFHGPLTWGRSAGYFAPLERRLSPRRTEPSTTLSPISAATWPSRPATPPTNSPTSPAIARTAGSFAAPTPCFV